MDETPDLLTARELASRLRLSPDTVKGWARSGRIPTVRLSSKVVRFEMKAVLAALAAKPETGTEVQHGA